MRKYTIKYMQTIRIKHGMFLRVLILTQTPTKTLTLTGGGGGGWQFYLGQFSGYHSHASTNEKCFGDVF